VGLVLDDGKQCFSDFLSTILIQPCSPCYLLLSHAMQLHAEPEWLLL
jgi:hypothetical protein